MGFEIGQTTGTLYKIKEDGSYEELARMSIDNCPSFDGSEEDDGIDANLKSGSFTTRFGDDVVSDQDAEFVDEY